MAAVAWGAAAAAIARPSSDTSLRQVTLLKVLAGLSGIGAAMNLASRSHVERAIWSPFTAGLTWLSWRSLRGHPAAASQH